MARWFGNPFAFTPLPVTFFTSIIYLGLVAALLVVHHVVPPAPQHAVPVQGINLTESWLDLQTLSNGFHPYNSRRNDEIRDWLLQRIEAILTRNGAKYSPIGSGPDVYITDGGDARVELYNDMSSNVTFSTAGTNTSIYFEGTNIIVYIEGSGDAGTKESRAGVLVNAHYDSVSTGFGATDDGVGVVSVLQLISYFTTPGNKPKNGIVALLNNGEEDYLNGARAFLQHPISKFPRTFLNLEGAGAGGRATLFRSTDTEVTKFYSKSKYPFGSVISADGFKRGLIHSETDYSIFTADLGLRGLDVAFMEPRSQYHTTADSPRDTSLDSVWHMLSAALKTTQGLSSYKGSKFEKTDGQETHGSNAVWFDLFGRTFAVFRLHTLFALSVTLLVVGPLALIALNVIIVRVDKWYVFSRKTYLHSSDDDESIGLGGWKGFFRFPFAFAIATAAVVALAYLVTKVNPNIVYSSQYAVWSMMLTAWLSLAWFVLRGANAMRPSALSRFYVLFWLYILFWVLLVATTVGENNFQLGGVYFIVIYAAAVFTALLISYFELFALPKKSVYAQEIFAVQDGSQTPGSHRGTPTSSRPLTAATETQPKGRNEPAQPDNEDDDATETTSLLRGDRSTTFARYGNRRASIDAASALDMNGMHRKTPAPYKNEQPWSGALPSWTWFLQLLLLVPVPLILLTQTGLLITSALHQTLADGSPAITVYLLIAAFSTLILLPATPFLHRFTHHIPTILFFICIGTIIYNLLAFPFSPNNRLKLFFIQRVDLDAGTTTTSLTGLDGFVQNAVAQMPSAAGQPIHCGPPDYKNRAGLVKCAWAGIPPRVAPVKTPALPLPPGSGAGEMAKWVHVKAWRVNGTNAAGNAARFEISGQNTRACKMLFDAPISDFAVKGAAQSSRFARVPEGGATEIRLWSREWERGWTVDVEWKGGDGGRNDGMGRSSGMDGKVVCLWSDANAAGSIPALDEVVRELPRWAVVSKLSDGLVEGSKRFAV
ncbi:putative zinc metalloprotease [Saccharata proteae CBS 121410]|uniref:Peptide hydrolase n=1 Tax=Saccharata proteae CBS 121410 TaxID=1314787 RepID=A0A9P4LYX5_9PEZI|nr:putative zinc metalloprotease [Saccharata proteae CBS 121410]